MIYKIRSTTSELMGRDHYIIQIIYSCTNYTPIKDGLQIKKYKSKKNLALIYQETSKYLENMQKNITLYEGVETSLFVVKMVKDKMIKTKVRQIFSHYLENRANLLCWYRLENPSSVFKTILMQFSSTTDSSSGIIISCSGMSDKARSTK